MQTWTRVRFLHIVMIVFFVGGQLMLVAVVGPAIRKRGDEQTMRLIARRFGIGSLALAVVVATGVAMASHFSLSTRTSFASSWWCSFSSPSCLRCTS